MKLLIQTEHWDMAQPIVVSRGAYGAAELLVVTLEDSGFIGRGEACPLAHYGDSVASASAQIEAVRGDIEAGVCRQQLLDLLPKGPARNAVDCALWDLEAHKSGASVWDLTQIAPPAFQPTTITLSLAPPEEMAAKAREHSNYKSLKLKLGQNDVLDSVRRVRMARPDAVISIDANEAWSLTDLMEWAPALADMGVAMVEQPLAAGRDDGLADFTWTPPICADESFHASDDLDFVQGKYQYVNIKLDKCGGLTEALRIQARAADFGQKTMVGCMFATSLAIAPALVVAARCDFVDLDGPLHLKHDREDGFRLASGSYDIRSTSLWGKVS